MADHSASTPHPVQASDYRKFLAHLATTVIGLALAAYTDGRITSTEALQLLVVGVGTAAVYIATNVSTGIWAYTKAICAWIVVVAAAAVPYAAGGWPGLLAGVPVIAAAAAGALGVGVVPNTGTTTLADAVRDILTQVQQVRADVAALPAAATAATAAAAAPTTTAAAEPAAPAPARRRTQQPTVTVASSAPQPPLTTSGARTTSSPVDTATLQAVRARSGDSYLDERR